MLLSTTFPLLAQEVFELVHELLRVKVDYITPWARHLVPRRVIVLLESPDIGLDGSILRDSRSHLVRKARTAASKGATSSSRSSRWATVVSSARLTAGSVAPPREWALAGR